MIKLNVNLANFENFKREYELSRGRYSLFIAITNSTILVSLLTILLSFYTHEKASTVFGVVSIIVVCVLQLSYNSDIQKVYKSVLNLLDTIDENGLFYYIKEDVLTTNNTIIKGLKYEIIEGSCNQLSDSYVDGEYKLYLEISYDN